jgi:4-amino-4-deoxy-L-arabinose transferase-like glycosyltransferase
MEAGNQTPLYFWSLRILPNNTELLLRLPSALMGVLGVALLMFVAHRLYDNKRIALWAGALLAVNPVHVMLSRTARPYALLFVLSLSAAYCFLLILRGDNSRKVWAAFVGFSMLAYMTHYGAGGLAIAQGLILFIQRRNDKRLWKSWFIAQCIAVIPFVIWMGLLALNFKETTPGWSPTPTLGVIPVTFWNLMMGYDGRFAWHYAPAIVLATIGVTIGVIVAVRERAHRPTDFYFVLLILAAYIPVAFIAFVEIAPAYKDRYFVVFLPALLILMIVGWMQFPRQIAELALVILVVTAASNVVSIFSNDEYIRSDWDGVTAYIADEYEPGDRIVFERWNTYFVFDRYYEGDPSILDERTYLIDSTQTAAFEQNAGRVWVIYRNPNEDFHRQGLMPDFDPFASSISPMGDWLHARRDRILQQKAFHGVKVFLLSGGD